MKRFDPVKRFLRWLFAPLEATNNGSQHWDKRAIGAEPDMVGFLLRLLISLLVLLLLFLLLIVFSTYVRM